VNDGLYGNGCVFSVDTQTMEVKKVIDLNKVNGAFPAYGGLLMMFDTVFSHVDEVKTGMEIELVPNPATEKITVISHGIEYQPDKIEIYSLDGKALLELKSLEGFKTEIDLKGLRNGVYLLKAYLNDKVISRKFIKMN
jgi:hypothetical protein